MPEPDAAPEIPLVNTAEAIEEVRRWLEVDRVDPERIFATAGDQVIRYKDLVSHLERGTPDGEMLRFAISRGRMIRQERAELVRNILTIGGPGAEGEHRAPGTEHRGSRVERREPSTEKEADHEP